MATHFQKSLAWMKAKPIPNMNPNRFRMDHYGNLISWSQYGKDSRTGWVVDHIRPLAKGGTNSPQNIQALQIHANLQKGDTYPYRPRRR